MKNGLQPPKDRSNFFISVVILAYLVIAPFAAYAYDIATYQQYFRWVFLYHVQPYYSWVFGAFYNAINIGSLALNIPFYFAGLDNVMVQQFSEKLPLIISALVAGYSAVILLKYLRPKESVGLTPLLLFLLMPITIFDVEFMANPLIVSLMFLMLSLVFIVKSRIGLASVFLGAAAATYLYPIFFFLPFLRTIYKNFGKRATIDSITLLSLTMAVGQIFPLLISLLTGTQISHTLIAPLFGFRSSVTVSSTTSTLPLPYSPYYIVYFLTGFVTGTVIKEVAFIAAMAVPVILFLSEKGERINTERYVEFLFLESLIYVLFAITAEPQYLLAVAPFSLILYFTRRNSIYIEGIAAIFLLDLFIFFSRNPLLYFFSNINPAWFTAYRIAVPISLTRVLSLLYILSLSALVAYHLYITKRNIAVKSEKREEKLNFNSGYPRREVDLFIKRGIVSFFIIFVVSISLVAPSLGHVPSLMIYTEQSASDPAIASHYDINPNSVSLYLVKMPEAWSLSSQYTRDKGTYYLDIPEGLISNSPTMSLNQRVTNTNQNLSVTVYSSANPVEPKQNVTLYSIVNGGSPPYNYTWNGYEEEYTRNYLGIFPTYGNWSVNLTITDTNGLKVSAVYTEEVGFYYYNVSFDSVTIGTFNSSTSHQVQINSSEIKSSNYLEFGKPYITSNQIRLIFYIPLDVPASAIYEDPVYLFVGLTFTSVSVLGLVYLVREIKKKE